MKAFVKLFLLIVGCLGIKVKAQDEKIQQMRPGEATEDQSCNRVSEIPQELFSSDVVRPNGLNATFYRKYTEAYGFPILSSDNVPDDALKRACYTVRVLFAGHSGLRRAFYKLGGRFAIIGASELTLDIPEYSDLDESENNRTRGLGGNLQSPLSSGAEENLLCYADDRYPDEDIFLHEAAHGLQLIAANIVIPGFTDSLINAYKAAKVAGLWNNTYAMENEKEYFAEGTQSFFNVNTEGPKGGDGINNDISTNARLKAYDNRLYRILSELFPCPNTFLKRCESTREQENNQVLRMNCNTKNSRFPEPPITATCFDVHPVDCIIWSQDGECQKSPSYMNENCKYSCKKCPPADCTDQDPSCGTWAEAGECQQNPGFMLSSCKRSCNRCN